MIGRKAEIPVSRHCKVPASPPPAERNGRADVSVEPLLASGAAGATLCGVSARTWRRLDLTGQIPKPIRLGGSKRWSVDELRAWIVAGCPGRHKWEALRASK